MNWATEAAGATIDSFSSQVSGCEAEHVLSPSLSSIWLSEDTLPQFLVISLKNTSASKEDIIIRSVGWHCWHAYTTNPFKVSLSVSSNGKNFKPWDSFVADRNKGTQLFSCVPISARLYPLLMFEVTQTFGGLQTYMNRVFLFEEEMAHSPLRNSASSLPSQPEALFYDVKEDLVQSVSTESLVDHSAQVSFSYAADISQSDQPLTLSKESQRQGLEKENSPPELSDSPPAPSEVTVDEAVGGPEPVQLSGADGSHIDDPDCASISSVSVASSRSSKLLQRLGELEHKYSRLSRKVEELESSASNTPGTERDVSSRDRIETGESAIRANTPSESKDTQLVRVMPSPSSPNDFIRPSRHLEERLPPVNTSSTQTPSRSTRSSRHIVHEYSKGPRGSRDISRSRRQTASSCDTATQTDYRVFIALETAEPVLDAFDIHDIQDSLKTSLKTSSIQRNKQNMKYDIKPSSSKKTYGMPLAQHEPKILGLAEKQKGHTREDTIIDMGIGETVSPTAVKIPDDELVRIVHAIHNKVLVKTQKTLELELMKKLGKFAWS